MREHRPSRAAYRLLLRAYPREFRRRFAPDLEADFYQMRRTRGALYAWRRALADLCSALPLTTSDAAAEHARIVRIGGPITPPGEPFMRSLLFDLRHGFRALVKAPGFSVVTILTLALGIGANAAIFTLVNAALVRPLGFEDPDRLMLVYESIPGSGRDRFGVSPADYVDLLQYQQSFSTVGAYRTTTVELPRAVRSSPAKIRASPRWPSSATAWRRVTSPGVRRSARQSPSIASRSRWLA